MCGIAGILNLGDVRPPTQADLAPMVRMLRHRGPDADGFWLDEAAGARGRIGLGHSRLSIIDLSGGAQPLSNEDGSIWISFNGEIFNYLELRDELVRAGHTFRTRSDTEVLVHAYEEFGLAFLERLNGQFALAIWDGRTRRLVLARDRVGILPLFYTRAGGRLLFASEVKALLADSQVERRLDPTGVAQVMTYWSTLPPRTIFAGIEQLPPGHVMTVDEGGKIDVRRYWDFQFPRTAADTDRAARLGRGTVDERAAALRELLIDAVRLRLRSDVPVGAYLSGGLDSSILALLVDRYTDAPLRTFSLVFDDAEFDESRFQRTLAAQLSSEHSEVRVSKRDIGEAFPKMVWHAESTVLRTAPTPLMLLSGLVRRNDYRVVLTGEGADEAFGGYDLFREAIIRRFWARRPDSKQRPRLLNKLYPYLKASPMASPAYAMEFFRQGMEHLEAPYFGHVPRWNTTRRTHRFFAPAWREATAAWDPFATIAATLPADIGAWEPLCRDQYIESHTLLSGYLLCSQGDRVTMASSVEARFPYLDHRVLALASGLPVLDKVMGLKEKFLLKRAFRDLLPQAIFDRPKQPYRAPDSQSFFVDGKPLDYVEELLSPARLADAGYFDPKSTGALLEKCRRGRAIGFADNMAFVGILSTMLVHEQFVRSASFQAPGGAQS